VLIIVLSLAEKFLYTSRIHESPNVEITQEATIAVNILVDKQQRQRDKFTLRIEVICSMLQKTVVACTNYPLQDSNKPLQAKVYDEYHSHHAILVSTVYPPYSLKKVKFL